MLEIMSGSWPAVEVDVVGRVIGGRARRDRSLAPILERLLVLEGRLVSPSSLGRPVSQQEIRVSSLPMARDVLVGRS